MDFPYIPCYILSLDVQDVVGTHIVDFDGELIKNRLDSSGKIIEKWNHHEKHEDSQDNLNQAMEAFKNKEGCKLTGNVLVNKISGNFHVSSHSFSYTANQLLMRGQMVDFSHKINHLSFGDESSVKEVKKLTKSNNLAPLDAY